MLLNDAYDYIDLLLDKADQPYFTTEEKNKFLNLAISDFISFHYQKMTADEDSRRAISGCIDWNNFRLEDDEIISGLFLDPDPTVSPTANHYEPALSRKYTDTFSSTSDRRGYFTSGAQYVLPRQHLYVLSIAVQFYNKDEVLDPITGLALPGVVETDVVSSPKISLKNVAVRDYYENAYSNDPFNKPTEDDPHWAYLENRIVISNSLAIRYVNMQTILLPTVEQAFSADTYEDSTAPARLTFADHYQKQIIQLAVEKMTQVDAGLITPSS